jgi:hypothetical protein
MLAAVLTYLKLCAHSVLLDDVRAAAASQTSSLDGVSERLTSDQDVATEVIGRLSGQRVWQIVLTEAQGRQEPVVARRSWARRMKPSQIYAAHPELFDSVAEVYRIKRHLVERLRRNPRLAELQN